ncbi:MAG TPA: histidine kinase [Actinomycetota bacterium]|jgi:signal transduction histidine kinase/plastocyanin
MRRALPYILGGLATILVATGSSRFAIVLVIAVAILAVVTGRGLAGRGQEAERSARVRRRATNAAFVGFFAFYAAACVIWLLAGIGPALARAFPSVHADLHRWAGTQPAVRVEERISARGNRFDKKVLTIRAGSSETLLRFTNFDGDGHNVSIHGRFRGAIVEGPTTVTYEFQLPPPGVYRFICDPHPDTMAGLLIVQPAAHEYAVPARSLPGWLAGFARRVAEASHAGQPGARAALEYVFSLLNVALGILLIRLRPGDRAARLLAVGLIGTGAVFNLQAHTSLTVIPASQTFHGLFHLVAGGSYVLALVVFPDGRLPQWSLPGGEWLKWPLRTALLFLAFIGFLVGSAVHGSATDYVVFFGVLVPVAAVASQVSRLRHAASPVERQQSRLLVWSLAIAFGGVLAFVGLTTGLQFVQGAGEGLRAVKHLAFVVFPGLFAVIPVMLVAVLVRYRLWDIERVLNKTLVYGTLAGIITAVYVAGVAGISHALGSGKNPNVVLYVVATAVVAVVFEPLRERLQRLANRLVYGRRATPYEIMADFSQRMSGSLSIDEVLPRMAEAAARGVGAARAKVRVFLPGGKVRSVTWPDESSDSFDRTLTIQHQEEPVGDLWVAKPPGEPLTPAESRLLEDLASQAGLALRNVRLAAELESKLEEISAQTEELRASRQRIVAARDAERRRLERDIHDGAQQQLVGMTVKLGLAEKIVEQDPIRATALLEEIGRETNATLETLRDLARGIFPPLLADKGLAVALEAQARKSGFPVSIEADEEFRRTRFSPESEAAAYFCCLEALANAAKHSGASPVTVRLAREGEWVTFSVSDRGPGFDPTEFRTGQGIQNMVDRVEAMGGSLEIRSGRGIGTTVAGQIPADLVREEVLSR